MHATPTFGTLAFAVIVLRRLVRAMPAEVEEAARGDGCGLPGALWRIVLPGPG
ncbi:hypothetical protein [Streptomyces sp. 2A115]|uniref:hypothetical protein n=1 Tax=Streptomyces sp. 2A115 TaxID=3457439 RepID=UPI003FD285C7